LIQLPIMPVMNKSICVCGAGTMGAGIAQAAAQHGFKVTLYDHNEAVLQLAREQIGNNLQSLLGKQKITHHSMQGILANINFVAEVKYCSADILIEAIAEKLEVKTILFRQLAAINGEHVVYASNTSSLSVTDIAKAHPYPNRLVGMHFFNPPTIMKLVEIIHTPFSGNDCIRLIIELAKDMGKVPVLCKDSPGFIVNRVARPFYIESLRLAEEGVSIPTIDALMESAGFKMGPFRLMDLIGNDINYAVSCSVYEQLGKPARLEPSIIQQQKVSEGKLGRKSGAGYYTYTQ
jgi:3-hydroxybutyryl-CoA dehydrogenase